MRIPRLSLFASSRTRTKSSRSSSKELAVVAAEVSTLRLSKNLKMPRNRCARTSLRWKRCPSHGNRNSKNSRQKNKKKSKRRERLKKPSSLETHRSLT